MGKHKRAAVLAAVALLGAVNCSKAWDFKPVYAQVAFDESAHGAVVEDGKCGSSIKYFLYEDGSLYLKGKGSMSSYDFFSTTPSPFSGNDAIRAVYVQDGITYIGSGSFYECQNLSRIELPETVTSIGYSAFDGTPWMKAQLASNQMVIVNHILINGSQCSGSVNVPDGVMRIGERAFEENAAITSLTLPDSVTRIEAEAFYGCSGLVYVQIPDSVKRIEQYAFSGCKSLVGITLPETMTELGESAFSECSSLVSIQIPSGLKKIDKEMFWFCSSLKTIEIPAGVTTIESGAFANCTGLELVSIPAGVVSIKDMAFDYCGRLQDIAIPSTVTKINDTAFAECGQKITVHSDSGSVAEQFAKNQGMDFTTKQLVMPEQSTVRGDMNRDGEVTLADAQIILKAALKIVDLNEELAGSADLTGDSSVTLQDAQEALKTALKIK